MSTNAAFRLQDAGFSRAQVEALGEFLDSQAATKTDLIEAKTELKAEIAEVKTELKAGIAAVRTELKAEIAEAKADIIKWMFGTIVTQTALIIAAVKLLH